MRDEIQLLTGFADGASATTPAKTTNYAAAFNFAGGALPMRGRNQSSSIEIGLDLTDFKDQIKGRDATFFLLVNSTGGSGTVDSLILMDYTGPIVKSTRCEKVDQTIVSGATTTLSIPWTSSTAALFRPTAKAVTGATGLTVAHNAARHTFRIGFPGIAGSDARLTVFDMHGKLIYTRAVNTIPNATSWCEWNQTNILGHHVGAGAYIAQIEQRGETATTARQSTTLSVSD
jgi:hypothetical protein